MERQGLQLKIISLLLQFPDDDMLTWIPELENAVRSGFPPETRAGLLTLTAFLKQTSAIALQEIYTQTFDLNPATCLNLTYHQCGDGEDRGRALASLQQAYCTSGYTGASGELPDFLPMILEYLALCPASRQCEPFNQYSVQIDMLAERLRAADSPYSALFEIISDYFKGFQSTGEIHSEEIGARFTPTLQKPEGFRAEAPRVKP